MLRKKHVRGMPVATERLNGNSVIVGALMQIEYRTAELRAVTSAFEVAGRAASYNTPSGDLGGFVERLQPGCFTRSLASNEQDVKCLVNHDSNQVLGRLANNTLTLTDTPDGLNFVCKLNKDSQAHRDLYASVKRGDLSECSFAFIVDGEDGQSFSSPDRTGLLTRTIKRAKLVDVSVVASPAYGNGATQVDARSIAAFNTKRTERKERIRRALDLAAEYSPLPIEEISRCIRLGYSADVMNELRAAAYGEQIRSASFGDMDVASPRSEDGGQVSDAQQSLRDDDDSFDWDADWEDPLMHDNAARWHKYRAWAASTLQGSTSHVAASALHQKAAKALRLKPNHPESSAASKKARDASKELL